MVRRPAVEGHAISFGMPATSSTTKEVPPAETPTESSKAVESETMNTAPAATEETEKKTEEAEPVTESETKTEDTTPEEPANQEAPVESAPNSN